MFGTRRRAVARNAARIREFEDVDRSPSFIAARMADAPKQHSVPEKWNWLLGYLGTDAADLAEYRID